MPYQILILLLIAGICGSIAQKLAGANRSGCLASIALGFIGAVIGTLIAQKLELPVFFGFELEGRTFPILWSIVGASLFSAVLAFLSGNRRNNSPRR